MGTVSASPKMFNDEADISYTPSNVTMSNVLLRDMDEQFRSKKLEILTIRKR